MAGRGAGKAQRYFASDIGRISNLFRGAHDGLERVFSSINWLEGDVCCVHREIQESLATAKVNRA
jgi:hypothetical protein